MTMTTLAQQMAAEGMKMLDKLTEVLTGAPGAATHVALLDDSNDVAEFPLVSPEQYDRSVARLCQEGLM